jgi:hypothetical protein
MPEFKLELYKDWTPEQLKQRCRSFLRAMGERDEIIKRIWLICHTASNLTIPADLHHAVTSLPGEDWGDREKVNASFAKHRLDAHPEGGQEAGC